MITYNKLVRDNIPDLINKSGKKCSVETIDNNNLLEHLYSKLNEEIYDLFNSTSKDEYLDEFSDILEIVFALGKVYNCREDEIISSREIKKHKVGSFNKNIILKKVY